MIYSNLVGQEDDCMPDDPLGVTKNMRFNTRLSKIEGPEDIPEHWRNTPIAALIGAHNFGTPIEATGTPELLIGTCIEFRFQPKVPPMYAYVIRRASGRLIGAEFPLLYTLAKGVKHVVLIGHDDCGMTQVSKHRQPMIDCLVDQGWDRERAEEYVSMQAGRYAIQDEIDSLESEYFRLSRLFKKIELAPLFVSLASEKLYIPNWYLEFLANPAEREAKVAAQDLLLLS
jgi:carbonic anhydrase